MVEFYQKYTLKNIVSLGGEVQCFCKNYQREHGYINTLNYFSQKSISLGGETVAAEGYLCNDWAITLLRAPALSNAVTFLVVVMNYVLRFIMIILIKMIGQSTETNQTRSIKNGIFIV